MDTENPNDPGEDEPATTTIDPNAEPAPEPEPKKSDKKKS